MTKKHCFALVLWFFSLSLYAENIRVIIAGRTHLSEDNPAGDSLVMSVFDTAVVTLAGETRFIKGVEIQITAPQDYLRYRGSMAVIFYGEAAADPPDQGVADISVRQLAFEPLPNKIQTVYQIPIRPNHGLRTTPYASVPLEIMRDNQFPLFVRLLPVIKGYSEEFEAMRFQVSVKPIFSDEGAVRIGVNYPEQLRDRPFILLIDDAVVENPGGEKLLREGEHHLVILSDDYRNENKRFLIERGRVLDLSIELQDPTPLVYFEVPANTRVYFDNAPVTAFRDPFPVTPGEHQVRFQVGDYSVIKPLLVEKGKTYRVALDVDVSITETE
ncbi:MAG: hypothetical protein LBK64_00660 [Spirochaetaceae bacterium]|jgi:hypothetical protein|nr:hypothetical protein [Spirochaetaceae bacterium]